MALSGNYHSAISAILLFDAQLQFCPSTVTTGLQSAAQRISTVPSSLTKKCLRLVEEGMGILRKKLTCIWLQKLCSVVWREEQAQASRAGAAETPAMEEEDEDDNFEDAKEGEQKDSDDNMS
ncbi:hypothetical protein LR48_Vigan05g103500 [Vigna angularis]|uniref:Uncharacterized protein n=1 Tax=Phaseolus angularis TaxID=3914 RepID=A0A0L9UL60_PHAAN|nr:hypothetical protein LR48_Vigan05g103500 [Vigna angularis]